LLQVRNLTVDYSSRDGTRRAVDDVTFDVDSGEAVGFLGESGCGKTTLAVALLHLLPDTARVAGGSIHLGEHDMLRANERTLRAIRGAEASIIFQEPALSLNPVMRVGDQVAEVARAHAHGTGKRYRQQAESALAEVGLSESRIYSSYPHQLSSGQRQRVAIAQALVCKPRFVIADEPTSALDNITQLEIVDLLKQLRHRFQMALLFITHNPALLVGLADRLLVMRGGRVVEDGLLAQVYENPTEPYTQSLLQSIPCQHANNA
jgi:ABC-type dipeptide/oligopeptide/nickel transport system ATPase component